MASSSSNPPASLQSRKKVSRPMLTESTRSANECYLLGKIHVNKKSVNKKVTINMLKKARLNIQVKDIVFTTDDIILCSLSDKQSAERILCMEL